MCLAACVSDLRRRSAHHSGLGLLVQPRTATQRPGLSEPRLIPGATINPGGLISGEHYRKPEVGDGEREDDQGALGLASGSDQGNRRKISRHIR